MDDGCWMLGDVYTFNFLLRAKHFLIFLNLNTFGRNWNNDYYCINYYAFNNLRYEF